MVSKATDRSWDSPELLICEDLTDKLEGMKQVLQERGLWRDGMKNQCGGQKKEKKQFGERLLRQYSQVQQVLGHSMRGAKLACPNTC